MKTLLDTSKWLPVMPDKKADIHLFCFPFAGGGVSIFKDWQKFLPSTVQLCPIAFPGREKRLAESPITSIQELVENLQHVLSPYLDRPFALFGHCFGGCVAFDLTLKLVAQGASPELLAISGCRAPHIPPPITIAHLAPDAFTSALRDFKLTPETVLNIPELLELFIPALRADFTLDEEYLYTGTKPHFNVPLLVMHGKQDHIIPWEIVQPWVEYSSTSCEVLQFSGDHVFFAHDPAPMLHEIVKKLNKPTTL